MILKRFEAFINRTQFVCLYSSYGLLFYFYESNARTNCVTAEERVKNTAHSEVSVLTHLQMGIHTTYIYLSIKVT